MIFFENERACGCVWIGQKFAITYRYTWFHILWSIFCNFRIFWKIWHFWKFSWFLEKSDLGSWIFGKSRGKIWKKVVKALFTEETIHFTSFLSIFHHFGVPQGLIKVSHFPKSLKISKNRTFTKFLKMRFPKCDFFRKWTY